MNRYASFILIRNLSCKQKSLKKHHTLLKLLRGKVITGARAARAKNSLFAMAVIKEAALRPLSMTRMKPKRFISAAVSSQRMVFCVTAATTLFDAEIEVS
jgi:hypothetical protein